MMTIARADYQDVVEVAARALYERDKVFASGWDGQSEPVKDDYRQQGADMVEVLTPAFLTSVSNALVAKFGSTDRAASFLKGVG